MSTSNSAFGKIKKENPVDKLVEMGQELQEWEILALEASLTDEQRAEFATLLAEAKGEPVMSAEVYPEEVLTDNEDDGTMPERIKTLRETVIGHKIVSAQKEPVEPSNYYYRHSEAFVITLDDGTKVELIDNGDCCAYTQLGKFFLNPETVDHVITGVGTTDNYEKWHIYAAVGDVLEMDVAWSAGNTGYYGYGFDIAVKRIEETNKENN